jgi:anionic cell wall polymer biosynthesis LytR-Cps2A-Psr (LCP) family protein
MDAVAILNDNVGGVTVQLMDDFTEWDASFVKDAVVTLMGEQALAYVQARGSLEDNTNLHRMERQQQYIAAFIEQLSGYEYENNVDTLMEVNEYLVSDCTIDQLSRMIERLGSYQYEGLVSPDGEAVKGSEFMEYYVDDKALQALVVEMFYELRD